MRKILALFLLSLCCSCVGEPAPDCETDNGGCDDLTTCTASDEGVTCGDCPDGFTGTGEAGCEDTDECETDNGGCDALTTCTNRGGGAGRECGGCPAGYDGDGEAGCSDTNECLVENGGCDELTTCTNVGAGEGRTCGDCPAGAYVGTGETGCELCDGCCFVADTDCRASEVCRYSNAGLGTCAGADGISYDIVIANLEICDRTTTGDTWDVSAGAPDLKVQLTVNGVGVLISGVEQDRFTAFVDGILFQQTFTTTDSIQIDVYDEDLTSDDYVGGVCLGSGCDLPIGVDSLRGLYLPGLNLGNCDETSIASIDIYLEATRN